jgi:hypothetical protein
LWHADTPITSARKGKPAIGWRNDNITFARLVRAPATSAADGDGKPALVIPVPVIPRGRGALLNFHSGSGKTAC